MHSRSEVSKQSFELTCTSMQEGAAAAASPWARANAVLGSPVRSAINSTKHSMSGGSGEAAA